MTSNDWVVVAEYLNTLEADMAKAQLGLVEIECELAGDFQNQLIPAVGATGPVKLMVRVEDEERARQVLEEGVASMESEPE